MKRGLAILAAVLIVIFVLGLALGRQAVKKPPQNELVFYLVAYGNEVEPQNLSSDWEKIGCEDFIVQYKTKTEKDVNLKTALDSLFTQKETLLPNGVTLHNALSKSKVVIGVAEEKDKTTVDLVGKIPIAGVCDTPRIKEQIERTIRYYAPQAKILYNGSESSWRCFGDESGLCE